MEGVVNVNIVILDGYTENPGDLSWEGFEKLGHLTVYDRTPSMEGNEEILRRAKGADAVILNKTPLTAATIEALLPELKYIGVLATGYNIVDVETAKKHKIPVCNVPSYATAAVAQLVMALILELCHHVGAHSQSVREGNWSRSIDFCYWNTPLMELAGKTFGTIGYGRIGRATATLAAAFGMKILACDKFVQGDEVSPLVEMDELLAKSDIISLHCPLTTETQGLINRESIAKMKDGVLLINTARGPLVNEEDLAAALNSGKIAGAGLDVLSLEPPKEDNPLLMAKNCVLTPHIAWAPLESRRRLMDVAVANLRCFQEGAPKNVVNL